MRIALIAVSLIGTSIVPSLTAQQIKVSPISEANTSISIVNNDTTVTILRGDKNSCEVTVKGKKLSKEASEKVCEQKLKGMTFVGDDDWGDLAFELNDVRDKLSGNLLLSPESLKTLQERQLALAKELQSKSFAFSDEGTALALRSLDPEQYGKMFSNFSTLTRNGRPIIGVTVDAQGRETDKQGAYVLGVTPNGPADSAGIKVNDIIVKLDGVPVSGRTERAPDKGESPTWIRLTEIVGKLEPGKVVDLEFARDGKTRSTKIKPTRDERQFFGNFTPEGVISAYQFRNGDTPKYLSVRPRTGDQPEGWLVEPSSPEGSPLRLGDARGFFSFGRYSDLELAALNDGLGSYFGTDKGVLVVNASEENQELGLQSGDVVLAVGQREVDSPSTMLRILRSYESGESVSLRIMRNKRTQTLTRILP